MKQLLPSKMVETEDSVRYSSSEVGRLTGRGAVPRLHAEPAGNVMALTGPLLPRSLMGVFSTPTKHQCVRSSEVLTVQIPGKLLSFQNTHSPW